MYCIDGRYRNIIIENFSNYNGESCNDDSDCYSNFCANNICYNGSTCNGFSCPNESNCFTKEVTFDASGNLTSTYNDTRICIKSKKGENGPKYRDRTNAGMVRAPTTPPAPTTLAIINTGATDTDTTDTGATDTSATDTTDETDITAEASATNTGTTGTSTGASATNTGISATSVAASTTTQAASTTTVAASTTTVAASTTTRAAAVATTINTTEGEFEQDIQTDDDEEYNIKIDIENVDDENVDDENVDDENIDDEENNNNFMTPRFKRMLIISGSFAGFIILILIIILIIIFARG